MIILVKIFSKGKQKFAQCAVLAVANELCFGIHVHVQSGYHVTNLVLYFSYDLKTTGCSEF